MFIDFSMYIRQTIIYTDTIDKGFSEQQVHLLLFSTHKGNNMSIFECLFKGLLLAFCPEGSSESLFYNVLSRQVLVPISSCFYNGS